MYAFPFLPSPARLRREINTSTAVWFRYIVAGFITTFIMAWLIAALDFIDENPDEQLHDEDYQIILYDVYFDFGSRREIKWIDDAPGWLSKKYPEQYVYHDPRGNYNMKVERAAYHIVKDAHGWPMLSFESVHWCSLVGYISDSLIDIDAVTSWDENLWCVVSTRKGEYGSVQPTLVLPLKPIIWGILIDTMFYAGCFFLIRRGSQFWLHRRRLRRSLCPQCSYYLVSGTEGGCPECGWNRPED